MENISFPQYRKYSNGRTFFRILSGERFEELSIMGSYYQIKSFHAYILPDRVLIEDMLQNYNNHWLESNQDEYEEKLKFCRANLKKVD